MEIKKGLAFDDVLLAPIASEVIPSGLEIVSRVSKSIKLSIPLLPLEINAVTENVLVLQWPR